MISAMNVSAPLWRSVIHRCSRSVSTSVDQIVRRFEDRLNLQSGMSFRLTSFEENQNQSLKDQFNKRKKEYPILQLYHAIRDVDSLRSIFDQGFYCGVARNKGVGVYLANHSRYSLMWAGTALPVIVCDVIGDPAYITRHRSEIYSPMKEASEYVVIDPALVYPRYALKYEFKGRFLDLLQEASIYVARGQTGCKECDMQQIRCDCPQDPNIEPKDIYPSRFKAA